MSYDEAADTLRDFAQMETDNARPYTGNVLRQAADELDRLRADNNRLRAALKRARIDAGMEFARAQSNFKRGQELWRERNEARAEVERLRAEVNRLHDADRAPELALAEIVGPELAEQEAARLRSQDNGLIRLLSAMLRQAEGQLRDARAERDEWKRLAGNRQERVDAAWDIINTLHKMVSKELYELRPDWAHVNVIGDTMNVIHELKDEWEKARRFSAAWKQAAKRHRAGRHLAARLFAEWLRRGIEAEDERDKARRWAVQGYRLMRAVESAVNDSGGPPGTYLLRDLVRRYREGRL